MGKIGGIFVTTARFSQVNLPRSGRVRGPTLHGWIYDLRTGDLEQIAKVDPGNLPNDIFVYEFPNEPPNGG